MADQKNNKVLFVENKLVYNKKSIRELRLEHFANSYDRIDAP